MFCLKKVPIYFLICFSFVLSAENLKIEKPVLGKMIERNGHLYDTFYYHMDGEPQYLLQKYDEIAIPHSEDISSLKNLRFNGINFSELVKEVTFDAQNCRAFKIKLEKPDRKNWLQARNFLAKHGIAAWPVLTYHAKNTPVVLDGTMNLVFHKYTSKEEQEKILETYGLKVVEIDEDMNFYTVSLPAGTDPFAIANSLFERQFVRWAQPNWLWRMKPMSTTPDDTYFSKQWHLTQINAPEAWDYETADGKDVRIAIVDTGVDFNHPDLNILTNLGKDYIGNLGGRPNTSGNPTDHRGVPHGTACAGLAAAKTNNGAGVAATCWGCPIIPIRLISDGSDYAYSSAYKDALKYAVNNGAWVVSNSWGADDTDDYGNCISTPADNNSSSAVDYGRTSGRDGKGTIFLWAAGNSHCNTNKNGFLKDNDFLTISAIGQNGALENYSNYGAEIDLAAGAGNNTTDITGTKYGYAYSNVDTLDKNQGDYTSGMNGTSAATPVAAGAVALMLAANPSISFSGAMNCIKSSARKPSTSCSEGSWANQSDEWIAGGSKEHSPCFGFGIVDAQAMVVGAKNGTCGECVATSTVDGCYGNYYDRDDNCDGILDNDCSNGGHGKAADACTVDSDCINTAETPACLTGGSWKGGYCSASCTKNTDCYNGNSNVECYEGQCIAKCGFNEIRSGYACISNKILPGDELPEPSCGNNITEEGEVCDGDSEPCKSLGSSFTGGTAFCKENCTGYDTSTCAGGGDDSDSDSDDDQSDSGSDEDSSDSGPDDDTDSSEETENCGDGVVDEGEECDDGNRMNGDGCSKRCRIEEIPENCGDGELDEGEECDDGNRINGDGCTKYCRIEENAGDSGSESSTRPGELGGECYSDGTCDYGLHCNTRFNTCMELRIKKSSGCSVLTIN